MTNIFKLVKENAKIYIKDCMKNTKLEEITYEMVKLKVNNKEKKIVLNWDQEELKEELKDLKEENLTVENKMNYLKLETSLSGFIVNLDMYFMDSEFELDFDGDIKGKISSKILDYKPNILFNLHKVIDWSKLEKKFETLDEVEIKDVIKKEFIIIDIENYNSEYQNLKEVINSVLISIHFNNNIKLLPEFMSHNFNEDKNLGSVNVKYIRHLDITKYFICAENLNSIQYKYLEYYHILEYHFLIESIRKLKMILNTFTLKGISVRELQEVDYYSLVKDLVDNDKKNNELNQLVDVLKKLTYKGIAISLNRVEGIDNILQIEIWNETSINLKSGEFKALINSPNNKFKEDIVDEVLTEKFIESLAKKIYKIRNMIVHTKRSENQDLFLPTKDNLEKLERYVILIRQLSFSLLNINEI